MTSRSAVYKIFFGCIVCKNILNPKNTIEWQCKCRKRKERTSLRKSDFLSPQSFLSLVNLLSSSHSVWELLGQKPLANKTEYTLREVPGSMPVSGFSHLVFHTLCSNLFLPCGGMFALILFSSPVHEVFFGCFGRMVSFPWPAQTMTFCVHFPPNITVISVVFPLCSKCFSSSLLLSFHRIWLTGWLLWIQKRRLIPCSTMSSLIHLAWGEVPFLCFII